MRHIVVVVSLVICLATPLVAQPGTQDWRTPAEISGYRATPSYDETLAFLRRVEVALPEIRLESFGVSAQGRAMPVVVVDSSRRFDPDVAARNPRPVVLIQNGIHSGEIDGKDACLELLRDWALGRRRELLSAATLLILPIYNVDGHERVSPFNRANQMGPEEGLGFRTTAAGLDLNRDFLKAQAPETRALLGLVNRWNPDLHVDIHVTDGSDHDWVLTWSWAEAPQAPGSVDRWLGEHMPSVLAATEASGHRCGPYVDLIDGNDPAKGFSSWVGGGRYATGYFPLRNRPSVLLEMHAYKPYAQRVPAVRDFLVALLAELKRSGAGLHRAVRAADAEVMALGRPGAEPSTVALSFRDSAAADTVSFPIYAWTLTDSLVTGRTLLQYRRGQVRELEVPWHHRVEVERSVPRPRGYLVDPGWPVIEAAIAAHGLRFERLGTAAEFEVDALWVHDPEFAEASYQGLVRVTAQMDVRRQRYQAPAGSLWIPADQPRFAVAVQLLEPDCPDSLLAWGLLSSVFERKEYVDPRTLERLAQEMMADEATVTAWQAALKDAEFAASWRRRYLWWYERTPYYAAQEVGRLPILRVVAPPLPAAGAAPPGVSRR